MKKTLKKILLLVFAVAFVSAFTYGEKLKQADAEEKENPIVTFEVAEGWIASNYDTYIIDAKEDATFELCVKSDKYYISSVYKWDGSKYVTDDETAVIASTNKISGDVVCDYKVTYKLKDFGVYEWSDTLMESKAVTYKVVQREFVDLYGLSSTWKYYYHNDYVYYCCTYREKDYKVFDEQFCSYYEEKGLTIKLNGVETTAQEAKIKAGQNDVRLTIEIDDIEKYCWYDKSPDIKTVWAYFCNSLVDLETTDTYDTFSDSIFNGETVLTKECVDSLKVEDILKDGTYYDLTFRKLKDIYVSDYWQLIGYPSDSYYETIDKATEIEAGDVILIQAKLTDENLRWSDTIANEVKNIYVVLTNELKPLVTPVIAECWDENDNIIYNGENNKFFEGDIDFENNTVYVDYCQEGFTQALSNDELVTHEVGTYTIRVVPNDIFNEVYTNYPCGIFSHEFTVSKLQICQVNSDLFSSIPKSTGESYDESTETYRYVTKWRESKEGAINFFKDEIKSKYTFNGKDIATIKEYALESCMKYNNVFSNNDLMGDELSNLVLNAQGTYIKYTFEVEINEGYEDYVEIVGAKEGATKAYFVFYVECKTYYISSLEEVNHTYDGMKVYPAKFDYLDAVMIDANLNVVTYASNVGTYTVTYTIKEGYENKYNYKFGSKYLGNWNSTEGTFDYDSYVSTITISQFNVDINLENELTYDNDKKAYVSTYDGFAKELYDSYKLLDADNMIIELYKVVEGEEVLLEKTRYITDAGTYRLRFKLFDNSNYKWNVVSENLVLNEENNTYSVDFIIEKAKINAAAVIPSDTGLTYNGKDLPLSFTYRFNEYTTIRFDYTLYKKDDTDRKNPISKLHDSGDYVAVISEVNEDNYTFEGKEFDEIKVKPVIIELSLGKPVCQYGVTFAEIEDSIFKTISRNDLSQADIDEIMNHTWVIVDADGNKIDNDKISTLKLGTYNVKLEVVGNENTTYEDSYVDANNNYTVNITGVITIEKRVVDVIWALDDFEYNGENQEDKITAKFVDQTGKTINLAIENTNENVFKNAGEYRFVASFDEAYDTEEFKYSDYYVLPVETQKVYEIRKQAIDWSQVVFADYKVEYEAFVNDHSDIEGRVQIQGLPEEVEKVYDISNVRVYFGKYDISVSISGDNFDIPVEYQTFTAQFIVGAKQQVITKETSDIAIIEANDEGDVLDPTLRLVVESADELIIAVTDEIKETDEVDTSWKEKVISIYDVSLIDENNVKQQPDGTLKVSLQIPEEILGGQYRIFHRHTDENGNVTIEEVEVLEENDGYAVFITDKLSEFIFVYEYTSLIWLMVIVGVLILASLALLVWQAYRYAKKNGNPNKKKGQVALLSAAPIFYMPGHVETVFILLNILVVCLVINLVAFLFFKGYIQFVCHKIKQLFTKTEKESTATPATVVSSEEENKPLVQEEVKAEEPVSLKESLAKLENVEKSENSKGLIASYLKSEYKDQAIVNERPNYTKASSKNNVELPLADTHYIIVDGKKVCFCYVYENKNGNVLILLKTTEKHYNAIKELHPSASVSRFPKVIEGLKWYSLPIDETYSKDQVLELLHEAVSSIKDNSHNAVANTQEAWVKAKQEELKTMELEEKDDENGIDVIGVFFKNRENKIYYFAYNGEDFEKGEVASFEASNGEKLKAVVAIPKIKRSEEKLNLPLKFLNKLQ